MIKTFIPIGHTKRPITVASWFSSFLSMAVYKPYKMQYVQLSNGYSIPCVGFGTSQVDDSGLETAVYSALDSGYRNFDCAAFYGNEKAIGVALAQRRFGKNAVERKDLFITSKVWNDKHHPKDVRASCEQSIRELDCEYLDLYLIHWPMAAKRKPGRDWSPFDKTALEVDSGVTIEETWNAMEDLVDAGLVRGVGVSNFNEAQLTRILTCTRHHKPVMLQIEVTLNHLNEALIKFAHDNQIAVTAYAPLGSPGFSFNDVPCPMNLECVQRIAQSHGKSASQILLRHALQRGLIIIPKSSHPERIIANIQLFDFELKPEEMQTLNSCGSHQRIFKYHSLMDHPDYPFHDEDDE